MSVLIKLFPNWFPHDIVGMIDDHVFGDVRQFANVVYESYVEDGFVNPEFFNTKAFVTHFVKRYISLYGLEVSPRVFQKGTSQRDYFGESYMNGYFNILMCGLPILTPKNETLGKTIRSFFIVGQLKSTKILKYLFSSNIDDLDLSGTHEELYELGVALFPYSKPSFNYNHLIENLKKMK